MPLAMLKEIMRLSEWLKTNTKSQADLARELGVSPGRVSQLLSDETAWPGRDLALRLAEVTAGAVTANDFLSASEGASQ